MDFYIAFTIKRPVSLILPGLCYENLPPSGYKLASMKSGIDDKPINFKHEKRNYLQKDTEYFEGQMDNLVVNQTI